LHQEIDRANAVIQRAARSSLLWAGFALLLLAGLLTLELSSDGRLTRTQLVVSGALAVLTGSLAYSSYRRLVNIQVMEAGFEFSENGKRVQIPWEALREVEVWRRGLRIHASDGRGLSIDLYSTRDWRPLLTLIKTRCPAAARITGLPEEPPGTFAA
jgi:hypothetical protein